MNPTHPQSLLTPHLDKTSKLRPSYYRKPLPHQDDPKSNLLKMNPKPKLQSNPRGYSCLGGQKPLNSGIDEMIKSSQPYKELLAKMKKLEHQHSIQKQAMIKSINTKNQSIVALKKEEYQLEKQKTDLLQMECYLQEKLRGIKEENQRIREYIELCENGELDMEVLQYAMNTDNMTYEELLELEQKMGSVSKGFTQEQVSALPQHPYHPTNPDQLCTICYYQFQPGDINNIFNCKHQFHHDCISSWLLKERVCPMCKQEIQLPIQMPL